MARTRLQGPARRIALAIAGITFSSVWAGYRVTTIVSWRLRVIPEDLVGRVFGVTRFWVLSGVFPGAILGGLVLGVVEVFAQWHFGPQARDLSAYLLLFAVLVLRPRGLASRSRRNGDDGAAEKGERERGSSANPSRMTL